ncbi:hypothetical protein ABEB36_004013 [Hypothenemus hampei]|uniref:Uncharacterized protein n=1 Tax=Hypothenemus hampei TaxID=57062 RepID=A0ABD1F1X5_HYPHA
MLHVTHSPPLERLKNKKFVDASSKMTEDNNLLAIRNELNEFERIFNVTLLLEWTVFSKPCGMVPSSFGFKENASKT